MFVPSTTLTAAFLAGWVWGPDYWKARSVLEVGERDNATPSELKAEIDRRAAEHGVAATVRLYATIVGDSPACETTVGRWV